MSQMTIEEINTLFVEKQRKKRITKMYKTGTHAEMFRIYSEKVNKDNKYFSDIDSFTYTELEDIGIMLLALFPNEMKLARSCDTDNALAYCLGRLQGKADVLNCQTKDNSRGGGYDSL